MIPITREMVIIECTTQRKNLRPKIEEFKGKIHEIKRGLDYVSEYRDYNRKKNIIFTLASKSSSIATYEELALKEPRIILLDSDKLTYYEKLAKAIPFRAKFDLLSDFGFSMDSTETLSVPAFKIEYGDTEMFNFFISPDDLIKISYVARRESQRRDFYQRMVEIQRLKGITEFLEKGGIFPTNIVIAINEKCNFKIIDTEKEYADYFPSWLKVGILELPKDYNSCWIIDGQHRLFSFKKGMTQKLAVLALNKPTINKQTEFFVTINKNAKPIKSNLIWDLEGDLRPNSKEGIISNAVKLLNKQAPFINKINIPSIGSGSINISAFCIALVKSQLAQENIRTGVGKAFIKNPLFNSNYLTHTNSIASAISFYFGLLCSYISSNKQYIIDFIIDNTGVSVFTRLYRVLVCLEEKKLTEKEIVNYIIPIIDFFEKKDKSFVDLKKRQCSSEAGKTDVLNELLKQLENINSNVIQFIGVKTDLLNKLIEFEYQSRKLIAQQFTRNDINIVKIQKNFPAILQNVENKIKKQVDNIPEFCDALTLGENRDIILRFWKDVFNSIFIKGISYKNIEEQFPSEDIFKAKFDLTLKVRNNLMHKKISNLTKEDEEEVEKFIERTMKILNQTI